MPEPLWIYSDLLIGVAAREAAVEEERQAARDARYAARKARKRKGR